MFSNRFRNNFRKAINYFFNRIKYDVTGWHGGPCINKKYTHLPPQCSQLAFQVTILQSPCFPCKPLYPVAVHRFFKISFAYTYAKLKWNGTSCM